MQTVIFHGGQLIVELAGLAFIHSVSDALSKSKFVKSPGLYYPSRIKLGIKCKEKNKVIFLI